MRGKILCKCWGLLRQERNPLLFCKRNQIKTVFFSREGQFKMNCNLFSITYISTFYWEKQLRNMIITACIIEEFVSWMHSMLVLWEVNYFDHWLCNEKLHLEAWKLVVQGIQCFFDKRRMSQSQEITMTNTSWT